MNLDQLIAQYGYIGVTIGTFLQNEPMLVMGGISVHRGDLELPWVIACAFLGSLLGNQMCFLIGHRNGERMLKKRPAWKTRSIKMQTLLDRHDWLVLLTYRFVPGPGLITPLLIGASGFGLARFALINIPAALLWAAVVTLLGSWFGSALEMMFGDIHRYETWLFGGLALLAVGLLGAFWQRSRKVSNH